MSEERTEESVDVFRVKEFMDGNKEFSALSSYEQKWLTSVLRSGARVQVKVCSEALVRCLTLVRTMSAIFMVILVAFTSVALVFPQEPDLPAAWMSAGGALMLYSIYLLCAKTVHAFETEEEK